MMLEPPRPYLKQKHAMQCMKTEMCRFFLSNRCLRGSRCTFAHSLEEIRKKPDLKSTSMCKNFLRSGACDNPLCSFAHDVRELRASAGFFKTKLCKFAVSGRCKHGTTCRFAHTIEELSSGVPSGIEGSGDAAGGAAASADGSPPVAIGASASDNGMGGDAGGSGADESTAMIPAAKRMPARWAREPVEPPPLPPTTVRFAGGTQSSVDNRDWADITSDLSTRDIASDQSTRAETSASVPTPNGSGESGQEEATAPAGGARNWCRSRGEPRSQAPRPSGERQSGRHCTTMMLTNVPSFLTQGALVSLLEDLTVCMRGAFDFFYCPWDPYQDRNLGYAIINFFSRSVAADFERQWVNQPLLPRSHGTKRLRVVPAALQGRAAHLRHFSGFSLAHHEDPRFRPLVRAAPDEPLRPMATSAELVRASQQFRQRQRMAGAGNTMPYPPKEETFAADVELAPSVGGWPQWAQTPGVRAAGMASAQERGEMAATPPADVLLSLLTGGTQMAEQADSGFIHSEVPLPLPAPHWRHQRQQPPLQQLLQQPQQQQHHQQHHQQQAAAAAGAATTGTWASVEGGHAASMWSGSMDGGSCPYMILQPGSTEASWTARQKQQEQLQGVQDGEAEGAGAGADHELLQQQQQCWALLLPQTAGGAGASDSQGLGSPANMSGITPVPYYCSQQGMPFMPSSGHLASEALGGQTDGAIYSD